MKLILENARGERRELWVDVDSSVGIDDVAAYLVNLSVGDILRRSYQERVRDVRDSDQGG